MLETVLIIADEHLIIYPGSGYRALVLDGKDILAPADDGVQRFNGSIFQHISRSL